MKTFLEMQEDVLRLRKDIISTKYFKESPEKIAEMKARLAQLENEWEIAKKEDSIKNTGWLAQAIRKVEEMKYIDFMSYEESENKALLENLCRELKSLHFTLSNRADRTLDRVGDAIYKAEDLMLEYKKQIESLNEEQVS